MSFVTHFGLTGFGIKRCNLFGHADTVPLTLIRCGIVSFIRFRTLHPVESYDEFLRAGMSLQDYLALKRPRVRTRLRAEVHKAKRQARAEVADEVRYWREAYQEQHARVGELQQRVWALQTTVKTLSGLAQSTSGAREGEAC
ncbi:hypothetical protein [Achromobacter deleyi]|uniref:hypothetical protein n=1 Tax=Achromobacter deleyi TaxID=1353891 RepID=UPI0014697BE1|nr:hypothetical protein [Achromobacter deleyi]CAB3870921.1 hypothetical protein LMG3412_02750 [Achromobacter deleyi]